MTTTNAAPDPLRDLWHRWFVEYNPLYLFSAALVLAGVTLVSYDLASSTMLVGLEMSAVAEVYALMLIGGAALLVRIGQRRAGVMVGLLAALYQCDLTMQTETSAYLGWLGWPVAVAWAGLFHGKLRLLALALQLRPSRAALFVPSAAALALAVLPRALADAPQDARTSLVALVVFAIGAAAIWIPRPIESAVGYDVRGRRAIRGTWAMWAAAAIAHVLYTSVWLRVDLLVLAPIAILLSTRFVMRERSVWLASAAALALAIAIDPAQLSIVAAMVATVLVLRALHTPTLVTTFATSASMPPYRAAQGDPFDASPAAPITTLSFGLAPPIVKQRLLSGALATAHLAAWTALVHGGLWRAHVVWLDVVLILALAVMMRRRRRLESMLPITLLGAHFGIVAGWIRAPHQIAELGLWSIGSGFTLLGVGLGVSWWLARRGDQSSTQTTPAIDVPSSEPWTAQ